MSTSRRAFTMIELAVAILVLAVGLAAALSVVAYSMDQAQEIIRESTAAQTAQIVLDAHAWGTEPRAINGYLATRSEEDLLLPAHPEFPGTEVGLTKVTVVLEHQGKEILTVERYRRPR